MRSGVLFVVKCDRTLRPVGGLDNVFVVLSIVGVALAWVLFS